MKLKLERLGYQQKAIDSVVKVFEGQTKNTFQNSIFFGIQSNLISLSAEEILENKKLIIADNGISEEVASLSSDNDYCIEMETGTGKTLVYIQTVYELFKHYGLTKFIIVVPSIAIKQGVLSTLSNFEGQLEDRYGFKIGYFEYDSKKLSRLNYFVSAVTPEIMVMTLQSFSSDDRIINQTGRDDSIQGMSILGAIAKTQPIIIMDEPQEGMDTENSIQRFANFNPLAKLRYSATHKVMKNLLYRLTPYDAYKRGLVKQIEVLTVSEKNDEATLKLEISRVQTKKGANPKVKLNAWMSQASGYKWKETAWLSNGADLADKTKNNLYLGWRVERIYKSLRDRQFKVKFTNGVELVEKQRGADVEGIFRQQLNWLINSHFQKKDRLKQLGIKCLSLVFIDRVDNYVSENGMIKRLFVEEYTKAFESKSGRKPSSEEIMAVQGYYFATTGKGDFTDSELSMRKNQKIYKRILQEKEKLLSFDDPIEFIFSHSALGVGWDNPNVFNIATLNHSYSEIKKRQELGRGLRICVNQNGERIYDASDTPEKEIVNLLTVVPNESYESFATQYQEDLREIYGAGAQVPKLRKNQKGKIEITTINRREQVFNSPEFRNFWSKLSRKTDYVVSFQEDKLVDRAVEELSTINVSKYHAEVTLTRIREIFEADFDAEEIGRETHELRATYPAIDIVEELSESTGLSYTTTLKIIRELPNLESIVNNPPKFLKRAAVIIKRLELEEMLRGLTYSMTGESLSLTEFKQVIETFKETISTPKRGVYDRVIVDSKSDPERNFALSAETDNEVVCFLKLPSFYKIPTPLGNYEPDFGIVVRRKQGIRDSQAEEFYFVIETKGTQDINDTKALREDERYKILCAQKHFEKLGIPTYVAPVQDYMRDFKNNTENFKSTYEPNR